MNSSDLQHPVDVRDILPDTYDGNTIINCPPWAFKPDQWTRAFLRGVAKLDLRDAVSAEAGVGPGTNQLYVTRVQKPGISYGSDLDGRLPKVASANVLRAAGQEAQQRFTPIHGNQSLLSWIVRQRLDVVLACIPQVPADHHDEETLAQVRKFAATVNGNGTDVQTDALSHYYDPDTYVSDLNVFGLGLNDHLLQQARGVLRAKGKAILNLGGRPGRATLEHLFRKNGFVPTLLHSELIAQHAGTDLEPLATLETQTDHKFEFFADSEGKRQITAREAEDLRRAGHTVFFIVFHRPIHHGVIQWPSTVIRIFGSRPIQHFITMRLEVRSGNNLPK
jgi:SAM-dependent methyltransferase